MATQIDSYSRLNNAAVPRTVVACEVTDQLNSKDNIAEIIYNSSRNAIVRQLREMSIPVPNLSKKLLIEWLWTSSKTWNSNSLFRANVILSKHKAQMRVDRRTSRSVRGVVLATLLCIILMFNCVSANSAVPVFERLEIVEWKSGIRKAFLDLPLEGRIPNSLNMQILYRNNKIGNYGITYNHELQTVNAWMCTKNNHGPDTFRFVDYNGLSYEFKVDHQDLCWTYRELFVDIQARFTELVQDWLYEPIIVPVMIKLSEWHIKAYLQFYEHAYTIWLLIIFAFALYLFYRLILFINGHDMFTTIFTKIFNRVTKFYRGIKLFSEIEDPKSRWELITIDRVDGEYKLKLRDLYDQSVRQDIVIAKYVADPLLYGLTSVTQSNPPMMDIQTDKMLNAMVYESKIVGSELIPVSKYPSSLAEQVTKEGAVWRHHAWGIRMGDYFCCSTHQVERSDVRDTKEIKFAINGQFHTVQLDDKHKFWCIEQDDLICYRLSLSNWATLGVAKAKVPPDWVRPDTLTSTKVNLYGVDSAGHKVMTMGRATYNKELKCIEHYASTDYGWSGTGLYTSMNFVIGIQTMGNNKVKPPVNMAVPIGSLYKLLTYFIPQWIEDEKLAEEGKHFESPYILEKAKEMLRQRLANDERYESFITPDGDYIVRAGDDFIPFESSEDFEEFERRAKGQWRNDIQNADDFVPTEQTAGFDDAGYQVDVQRHNLADLEDAKGQDIPPAQPTQQNSMLRASDVIEVQRVLQSVVTKALKTLQTPEVKTKQVQPKAKPQKYCKTCHEKCETSEVTDKCKCKTERNTCTKHDCSTLNLIRKPPKQKSKPEKIPNTVLTKKEGNLESATTQQQTIEHLNSYGVRL